MSSSSEEEEVDDDGAIGSGDEDALHGMVRGVGGMDEDEGLHWTELPHAYKSKRYEELKALCEARKPPVSSKRPNKDIMLRLLIHDFEHNHKRWTGKHNDSCEVCNKTGTLGCCYFCNVVLHPQCMPEPQRRQRRGGSAEVEGGRRLWLLLRLRLPPRRHGSGHQTCLLRNVRRHSRAQARWVARSRTNRAASGAT